MRWAAFQSYRTLPRAFIHAARRATPYFVQKVQRTLVLHFLTTLRLFKIVPSDSDEQTMKRLILSFAALAAVVACGGGTKDATDTTRKSAAAPAGDKIVIALIAKSSTNPVF